MSKKTILAAVSAMALLSGAAAQANEADPFAQGSADWQSLSAWFNSETGDRAAGANYWATNRNVSSHLSCGDAASNYKMFGDKAAFVHGCQDAKRRLDPIDDRRHADLQYRLGFSDAAKRLPLQTHPNPVPEPMPSASTTSQPDDSGVSLNGGHHAMGTGCGFGGKEPCNIVTALPPPSTTPDDIDPDYKKQLINWIESHKQYPVRARQNGKQGTVGLRFRVSRDGHVQDFSITSSSGVFDLDYTVEWMMGQGGHFAVMPPFPPSMSQSEITVSVNVRFTLNTPTVAPTPPTIAIDWDNLRPSDCRRPEAWQNSLQLGYTGQQLMKLNALCVMLPKAAYDVVDIIEHNPPVVKAAWYANATVFTENNLLTKEETVTKLNQAIMNILTNENELDLLTSPLPTNLNPPPGVR